MKRGMDPSSQSGSRPARRRGLEAFIATASLGAVTMAGYIAIAQTPDAPRAVVAPVSTTEMLPATLQEKITAENQKLARAIVSTASVKAPRFTTTTKVHPAEAGQPAPQATTEVIVRVESQVGGTDSGFYTLSIEGPLDREGKYVDPEKVEATRVSMDVFKRGEIDYHAGALYSYELAKIGEGNDEFHLSVRAEDDASHNYAFGPANYGTATHDFEALTDQALTAQADRAMTVLNQAAGAQPISSVPQS